MSTSWVRLWTLVVVLIGLVGCADTRTRQAPLLTSRAYQASYDKVWGTLVAGISPYYPLQSVDKTNGRITTQVISLGDGINGLMAILRYAYEPKSLLGTFTGGARFSLSIQVSKTNPPTAVRITGHFEAFEDNISKSWKVWGSNGVLETQILAAIQKDLER